MRLASGYEIRFQPHELRARWQCPVLRSRHPRDRQVLELLELVTPESLATSIMMIAVSGKT